MHQIWAIDPDSTPGVYVLLPTRKQSRCCARVNYSHMDRKGDLTCTPSSSKGRLKMARKKNSRRHGETKFSLRLKSRPDSWMRCGFLKPRILTGAWGLVFGRGKRTRNGITEKSFRSSSIRCSISLRPLRPFAPLLLKRPKPSAFLPAKPREPCVVAQGRTLSKLPSRRLIQSTDTRGARVRPVLPGGGKVLT